MIRYFVYNIYMTFNKYYGYWIWNQMTSVEMYD